MNKPKEILELEKYWGVEIYEKSYTIDTQGNIIWLMLHELPITYLIPLSTLKYLEGLFISNWLTPLKEIKSMFKN